MKSSHFLPSLSPVLLAVAVAIGAGAPAGSLAPVDHTFREAPLNSQGVKSLGDLRGKPVVIDFWGKN